MALIPLVLDRTAPFARDARGGESILDLPLGAGTVFQALLERLGPLADGRILLMRSGPTPAAEGRKPPAPGGVPGVSVCGPDGLDGLLDELDCADDLLCLDAARWPLKAPGLAEIEASLGEYRGVTHAVAIGDDPERASERIECDRQGRVKRVARLYASADWPEVAGDCIAWSVVPARVLYGLNFGTLGQLRRSLAVRGMLSRDVPVASDLLDLADEGTFLAYSEQALLTTVTRGAAGYTALAPGVLAGAGVVVHRSARLVPPLVIHRQTCVEADATVIGPALIGAGCRIARGATVAQAVIRNRAVVPAGTTIRHQVITECGRPAPAGGHTALPGLAGGGQDERFALAGSRPWVTAFDRPFHVDRRRRRWSMMVKRAVDAAAAAMALVVLSPLLLAAAIAVRLDSAGPVFFGHLRERKGGKEFRCLKFRTMSADADRRQRELRGVNQVDGPQFKMANDPRVTRVGRWLRATNIDELPQLINVLLGHMSLVGPRPSPFRENQICVPWRRARLSVRPGITGLWQICRDADRTRGDFHEWIYYDLTYVREFSLWLDLKILLATIITLGGRRSVPLAWLIPSEKAPPGGRQSPLAA